MVADAITGDIGGIRPAGNGTCRRRACSVVTAVALLCALSVPMSAHHSSAAFDVDRQMTLEGTVTAWLWSNPHCLLQFDVTGDDGQLVHWVAETQNPRNMATRGWEMTSFRPGDRITVTVHPARNGRPFARLLEAVLPSGRTLN